MKPISLYSNCPSCKGHGRIPEQPDGPRSEFCPRCRGADTTPTPDGRAIIGLLKTAVAEEMLER